MNSHEVCHMFDANGYQAKPFGQNFSAHNKRLPALQQHQPSAISQPVKPVIFSTRPENNLDASRLWSLDCRCPVIAFKY
jgi:hypothetical protein